MRSGVEPSPYVPAVGPAGALLHWLLLASAAEAARPARASGGHPRAQLGRVDRADHVPHDAAVGADEVRLGQAGDAPFALGLVARVAHVRERESELADEVSRVLAGVLRVEKIGRASCR